MIISLESLLKEDLRGKIVVFPTDTVYGIGCLVNDESAIHRIYQLKQRDYSKPLAILAPNFESIVPLVENVDSVKKIGDKYWPGALTLIARKSPYVCGLSTSYQDTVGVRIPNHPIALSILNHFGPMVTTSLNLSTEPAILAFRDVLKYIDLVDFIIDGGNLDSPASTVYDTIHHRILRQGEIVVDIEEE